MNSFPYRHRLHFLFAAEHGGDAVSGGGHPSDSPVPAAEAIADALGFAVEGRGKVAGSGDAGVPGSWSNPVQPSQEEVAALAQQYWEEEGRPEGKADDHWRRAEIELRGRLQPR